MEEDLNVRADLGAAQFQSATARKMKCKIEATSIVTDNTFFSTVTVDPVKVGSMNPPGDSDVLHTFRGARMQRAGETVNQYITMSLDPSNMFCISCQEEHPIVRGNKPVTVILSDENFVPIWPGTDPDRCVVVIRIEGGMLNEMIDLFGEIFGRVGLPEGSVLLMGSLTYLHRHGVSEYARSWTRMVMQIGRSWPTVRVGPLIPLIREDVPGGVARDLVELAAWFFRVYTGNIQGMTSCWEKLVTKVVANSTGGTDLLNPESYVISLPGSLEEKAFCKPHIYVTKTSRPSVLKGIDKGSVSELLGALADTLDRDFQIKVGIGGNSENAPETQGAKETFKRFILVGASNLNRVGAHLEQSGSTVINLCTPGWMATPPNVTTMIERLSLTNPDENTVVIFDVFGNTTFRYENWDGSVFMPVKSGGGYHLPGTVTVCTDSIFSRQVENVLPLLGSCPDAPRIILPPQPRYLFSGCCKDEGTVPTWVCRTTRSSCWGRPCISGTSSRRRWWGRCTSSSGLQTLVWPVTQAWIRQSRKGSEA